MWVRYFLIFLFYLPCASSASAQKKIHFSRISWYQAIAEAEQSDRFLFFYISQPGCAYCREFDQITLRNPEIRELLQSRFVLVKHSVSTSYGEAFARDFHLTHTPAVLLLNPKMAEKPDVFGEIYEVEVFLSLILEWINRQALY
jgi:thioredoxin-related protein